MHQRHHNSEDMIVGKGKPGKDWEDRTAEKGSQYRTSRTGQPGRDSQEMTAWKGPPRQDSQDRTGQLEQGNHVGQDTKFKFYFAKWTKFA